MQKSLNIKRVRFFTSFTFFLLIYNFFLAPRMITPGMSHVLIHAVYSKPVPVPMPTKMKGWREIVIHHSGAEIGNEEMIETDHLRRGMENGMAYHFLIGNGSAGLGDGQVVEGHRWRYQLPGGHCHQDFLNDYGIGVCLVGNFNRKPPTLKQIKSLVALLFRLQIQFYIPDENIHGHGQFYGEDSDCPGKFFPWASVWASLNEIYELQLNNNGDRKSFVQDNSENNKSFIQGK